MNDFASKRERRIERFRELAEKHENISNGRHFAARQQLEMIPPGQPILVGHHSERGHRAHLKRIDQHFAKAKQHHDTAEYFRRRAAAMESNRAIFSDDPDAAEKLVDKKEERTDKTLLGEFGLAALASLSAFFSAILTTVVEGHSGWRFFWLSICIICLVCTVGFIVKGATNFSKRQ